MLAAIASVNNTRGILSVGVRYLVSDIVLLIDVNVVPRRAEHHRPHVGETRAYARTYRNASPHPCLSVRSCVLSGIDRAYVVPYFPEPQ